jgi:hypothetical protein
LGVGIWGLRRLEARWEIEHYRIRIFSYLYILILYPSAICHVPNGDFMVIEYG